MEKLENLLNRDTVNSKYKVKAIPTVNSSKQSLIEKISGFIEQENIEPEGIALIIAELLDDKRSIPYYKLLVKEHNHSVLLELAYQVKERANLGEINTSKPIYFIGILRKKGFKTKFR